MENLAPIAYAAWIPATLALFLLLPPARALVCATIAGWLLLPMADFSGSNFNDLTFASAMLGSCLPSDHFLTKASVIGATCLLAVLVTDPRRISRFRPRWVDGIVLLWCLLPLASGLANSVPALEALKTTIYQALAWGSPWLLGRLYLFDLAPLREAAMGIVVGGLLMAPLCLLEILAAPVVYRFLYGFHPYQTDGIERMLGYRPIVLTEHGNQVGIWMAAAAITAFWLWRARSLPRLGPLSARSVVGVLIGTTVLCQSLGAAMLMAAGIALVLGLERGLRLPRPVWIAAVLLVVLLMVAPLLGGRRLASSVVGPALLEKVKSVSRLHSLAWRMNLTAEHRALIADQPILGNYRWNWYTDSASSRAPWSVVIVTLGMTGVAGVAALLALWVWPLAGMIRAAPVPLWLDPQLAGAAAITCVLAVIAFDSLMNPFYPTIFMAPAGGLVTFAPLLQEHLQRRA